MTLPRTLAAFLMAITTGASATAQGRRPPPGDSQLGAPVADYSDFAGLALAAPVVADLVIRGAYRVKSAQAPGLQPGLARFYVTGDIAALVHGPAGLPARMAWLVDVPADPRGRASAPRKKSRVLIYARTLPDRPGMLQLVAPGAQRPWTPDADRITRAVLTEALQPDAPPVISGVGNAFHVPGALPGEGETQIFLQTPDARPVSLSVIRTAAGERRWSVALSEIVDAAAPPPPRDTLLWYRLACALPPELPATSIAADTPADADAAREDYRFVMQSLGRCANPVRH